MIRLTSFLKKAMRVLCVAEKNDAARGIAGILSNGNSQRHEGRSKYNKIYRFSQTFRGQRADFSVTSVSGHLMQIDFVPPHNKWELMTISTLFEAPIHRFVPPNFLPIDQTLKDESRSADVLIIWTDCDREGENIGAEVVASCLVSNPRLEVFRAHFSEITNAAVYRALNNVTQLNQNMVDAVDCRSELDLRIGAAFTRLQTLHLQSNLPQIIDGVVSYGSCQFPTLGFVVERFKAIKEFIPEAFWKLVGHHNRNNFDVQFSWERNRLFNKQVVEMFLDECNDNGIATIVNVKKAPKSRWRPVGLDTVEFEKLAVRKLKMSAKNAMAAAEKLYTQGFISYPRTETNIFPPDINLNECVQKQVGNNEWGGFANDILQRGGANPRNGKKTDQAHPPIHPLKHATKEELGVNWSIYELVVRHFLACVSRDAKGQETTVKASVADEIFTANGIIIEDPGYLEVYKYETWNAKFLPLYTEGEKLKDFKVTMDEGKTSPPLLLNEADLIALMDRHGIGTDATHAEHIEKIKERQYVTLNADKRFLPGFLGLALVDAYNEMGFEMSKPVLRANLESQLARICTGEISKDVVLQEQLRCYKNIFQRAEDRIMILSQIFKRYLDQEGMGVQNAARAAVASRPPPTTGNQRGGGNTRGRSSTRPPISVQPNQRPVQRAQFNPVRQVNQTPQQMNCQCGIPATIRTANTERNRGKQFYACSKDRNDSTKCNFFAWVS